MFTPFLTHMNPFLEYGCALFRSVILFKNWLIHNGSFKIRYKVNTFFA